MYTFVSFYLKNYWELILFDFFNNWGYIEQKNKLLYKKTAELMYLKDFF